MMIKELLLLLKSKGISLEIKNDRLSVNGDRKVLADPEMMDVLRGNRDVLLQLVRANGPIGVQGGMPNLIPHDATSLTPEMLTLVDLDQAAIDTIVAQVEGGVANIQDIYPLGPLQEGILFHHLLQSRGDAYLTPSVVSFPSRERLDRFLAALQRVIDRHDVLRTGIAWEGLSQPVQVVRRRAVLPAQELFFAATDDVQACLEKHIDPAERRLDVSRAPLMQCWIACDEPRGRWLLALLTHHLALDHTTLDIMVGEAIAIDAGREAELAAPVPFRNFVAQARLGVSTEEHDAFFKGMLADIDEPTAPYGVLDVQGDGSDVDEVTQLVPSELSRNLRQQARRLGVSAASVMHLAWGLVLARVTGRQDVVFGTVLFGRMQAGEQADRGMGMFINTLPLRLRVDEQQTASALKQAHALLVELLHHEHAPLALAQRASAVQAPAPLFTSLLNYRHSQAHDVDQHVELDADSGIEMLSSHERTNYPLTLSVDDLGEGFALTVKARAPIAPDRLCAYAQQALEGLVAALSEDENRSVSTIDVLPAAERALVIHEWNQTSRVDSGQQCIHELFEAQVRRTPTAIALIHGNEHVDYAELNARANQLAQHLRTLGAGPDRSVALCVDRGIPMMTALLAILKAGAAYVPLDPAYPTERLAYMLGDSDPVTVIIDTLGMQAIGSTTIPLVDLRHDSTSWCHASQTDLQRVETGVADHHLAYVIYTSGSTGLPKGVAVEHRSVRNLWRALSESAYAGLSQQSRIGFNAAISFDASVKNIVQWLSGHALVIAPQDLRTDPAAMVEWIHENDLDAFDCTPPQLTAMCQAGLLDDSGLARRTAIIGGEAIAESLWRMLQATELKAWNVYGPTECTVDATCASIQQGAQRPHIGRPLPNVQIYVLDSRGRPVPIGVPGELHIGGKGVARGYLNRPELTAERFVSDPFALTAGARMYKSGDLARWLPDGTLEYLGRNDFQVKIRGFRIELGEIETQLSRVAGARDVTVLVRNDRDDRRLVAYYCGDAEPSTLREHASARLPQHMVPSAYVRVEHWPLTPNGKLDRKALPAPEGDAYVSRSYEAPQGQVEIQLAAIWSELLKVERVGRHDNFFELGGHSLLAIGLIERMRRIHLQADVRTLFGAPSLAELARQSTSDRSGAVVVPLNLIPDGAKHLTPEMLTLVDLDQDALDAVVAQVDGGAANVQEIYPLGPLQEGILFHHMLESEGDAYLLPLVLGFRSRERLDRILLALQRVIDRHDILRTGFAWHGLERPVQVVQRHAVLPVHLVNFDPTSDTLSQLEAHIDPARRRIDLSRAPLTHCWVTRDEANDRWLLGMVTHHLTHDHTTLSIMVSEALAIDAGREAELAAPVPFRNFVAQACLGVSTEEHEAFFKGMLADIDEPTAPYGVLDVQGDGSNVDEVHHLLAPELSARVRQHARRLGVSAASVMHLAWGLVLARVTGRQDVVFGTVLFGRMQAGEQADRGMGMFINTLPMRLRVDEQQATAALRQAHALLVELLHHEHAPLALAQRASAVQAPLPLFTSLLNYRHSQGHETDQHAALDAETGMEVLSGRERTNYPITLSVDDGGQDFMLVVQARRPIVAERLCAYMHEAIEGLLASLQDNEEGALANIDILPAAERALLIHEWNATDIDYPRDLCLHELFEAQAQRTPDAVALVQDDERLTYAELNARANQLARHLQSLGARPDDRIALCVERSVGMVVGLLAVLKAGAAYVPLDPTYPADRLAHMLEDSAPAAVLVDAVGEQVLAGTCVPRVHLADNASSWAHASTHEIPRTETGLQPHHLAYVIYTSGSTGRPKGAMNEHHAIVNRLAWMQGAYRLCGDDVVLQKTPFSFDVSVWEFFWPLTTGATLQLARPEGHKDPAYLQTVIQRARVTTAHFVPSMLQVFLEQPLLAAHSLRRVVCSGEALPATLVRRFHERLPGVDLHNLYGPTEAAVDVTAWQCETGGHCDVVPIGRPIANTRMYVLDDRQMPVPIGVAGELHIGGVQVGRGYLHQPELTAQRFLPDPFSALPGARMYKTGDLGRWLPDGTLEYLGRNDFQVKIRGFRIELGEIETQLSRVVEARDVVVLARDDGGDKRLVAYYAGEASPETLREHAQAHLPQYMVPSAYVRVEHWPLTPNGKLDRKALPAPEGDAYVSRGYEAPEGDVEIALAKIWSELLKVDQVGRHDNFFELGGHSLLAVSLIERMRHAGLQTDVRTLFTAPSLAELSRQIGAGDANALVVPPNLIPADATYLTPEMLTLVDLDQAAVDTIVAQVEGGAANVQDIYPLAPLQEGILFHHLMESSGDAYLLPSVVAFASRERLDRFLAALQRVIDRHDILRTGIAWQGLAQPVQVVRRRAVLPVQELDFAPTDDVRVRLEEHIDPTARRIDVTQPPLIQCWTTFDEAGGRWLLGLLVHHLAIDHTTIEMMVAEALAIDTGREAELAEPVPFRNFVAQARLGVSTEEHEAFFKYMLADIDEPTAPYGVLDVLSDGSDIDEVRQLVPSELSRNLRQQARRLGVSAASVMHLAWGLVLARVTGRQDVVFGTVLFGRMQGGEQADRGMGMFINTLPLRLRVNEQQATTALKQAHALLVELLHHEHAPLALAQRASAVQAPAPLFTSLLNYRHSQAHDVDQHVELDADSGIEMLSSHERTNYPLTLSVDDLGDDFALTVLARRPIPAERLCAYMLEAIDGLLLAMLGETNQSLAAIDILPAAERSLVLHDWNATEADYPRDLCLHELFEAQAQRTPGALALVHDDERLTYAELNARANQLARHLRSLGARPDDRVALCVERSVAMVVGLLAVLKAGAAYVPLDPAYPADRLAHMLEDSAPKAVLLDATGAQALAGLPRVQVVHLDHDRAHFDNLDCTDLARSQTQLQPHHLAYVIYTSGSTGRPKGAMNEHHAIVNRLAWMQGAYRLCGDDVVLQKTPFSFDVSVWEFFWPLTTGATLQLARPEGHKDPAYLQTVIQRARVTTAHFVPSMLQVFLEQPLLAAHSLRRVVCSGEALPATLVRRFHERLPGVDLHNLYGPTEAAVDVTAWQCETGGHCDVVPIGRPIANTRMYVLDDRQMPVPIGVAGELHIGGVQVGRGYLHQPELTAQRFLPDPFSALPGARMYKTGDLGRWLPDGTLEYLGRNDFQVKIRGFRIELGEIETQLSRVVEARDVVVLARDDGGDKRLVAYYAGEASPETLREHAQAHLPQYMVPSAYVRVEHWPLTPNGKLDRKALPAPEGDAYVSRGYEAPEGDVEIALAKIWSELLKVDQVGRHDNFFELGGHSLLAVQLVSRVHEALGRTLELKELFAHPVLQQLAQRIAQGGPSEQRPIAPVDRTQPLPLSLAQQRLWFLARMDAQASQAYHIASAVRLDGALDRQALDDALQAIVDRHESLRTRFVCDEHGQPHQVIDPYSTFELDFTDLSHGTSSDLHTLVEHEQATPFDLAQGPLLRVRLVQLQPQAHVLLVTMHHIVSDGWSMGVLIDEFSTLYAAACQGATASLAPLSVQYADYAAWQRSRLEQGQLDTLNAFWREALAGVPTLLELPTDRPRPAQQDYRGQTVPVHLDAELSAELQALSRRHGVTLYMTLLAAWALLLGRLARQDDIVVGSPVAGRNRREVEGLIGFFVNTLALRIDVSGTPDLATLLGRVKTQVLAAQAHQDLPFEQVVQIAQPVRSLAHAPLFQAMFAWQNTPGGDLDLPGLTLSHVVSSQDSAQFDLSLALQESELGIVGGLNYAEALFDHATIERYVGYWKVLLQGLVRSQPQQAVASLDILPEAERSLVLHDWNATEADYPRDLCLHELFEAQAQRTPGALALVHDDERLTYAELNARANQLARHLQLLGARPDDRIALCVERSVAMVVGLLAVLKAGAAYVPLDPAYPADRLAHMLEDSAPKAVLLDATGAQALAGLPRVQVVHLDHDRAHFDNLDCTDLARSQTQLQPHHLAYVIYTSGSTGRPKGVAVEHRGLCNLATCQAVFDVSEQSRVLAFASISFDAAAFEWIMALTRGACLHLCTDAQRHDAAALQALLRQQAITHATLPPALLPYLERDESVALRCLVLAGEAFSPALVAPWQRHCRVFNAYGPTESTVWASVAELQPGAWQGIGRAIGNVQLYVLDAQGGLTPQGSVGELYIGGAGVARGYLHQPELTAQRFLPDPFSALPGARMYKTGDLGRWLPDGTLEYLGRNDFQVKIRGFRIELGEIETQLSRVVEARDVVVLARDDGGDKRLVAYYAGEASPETLREHAQAHLPQYMVPSAYVRVEHWPLTPNGKLDRKALPAPEGDAYVSRGYEAPEGDVEIALAKIWSELLKVDQVGRHDNFFELGGHSLLAVQLVSRVHEALGRTLELKELFAHPVLQQLAQRIAQGGPSEQRPIAPVDRTQPLPLSLAQQRLWFLARMDAQASQAYHIASAVRLDGALDRQALDDALQAIVDRHESLRTRFVCDEHGQPRQVIDPYSTFELDFTDLSHGTSSDLHTLVEHEQATPFDLAQGPLLRVRLVQLQPQAHVLLVTMHHIVSDGWSMGVLIDEFSTLYAAACQGATASLAPLSVQYADYAAWQRSRLEQGQLDTLNAFWREALAGVPTLLELPTDRPRPAQQDYRGQTVPVHLDAELSAELQALSRRHGVTLYMTLLAAWALLLGRLARQDDIVVGSPVAGRNRREVEGLIGFFVNTLALRIDVSGTPDLATLLGRVKTQVLAAQAHQDLPFEQVVQIAQPVRSLAHAPLFQAMFAWQNTPGGDLDLPGLTLSHVVSSQDSAQFDLSLALQESELGIVGGLNYAEALFDHATIERYVGYWKVLLQGLVRSQPQQAVASLDILPEAERSLVLHDWNATEADYPRDLCLHELFEAQAQRTPGALALVHDDERLTYAELNARANQLARHLQLLGARPDDRIALCVERSVAMVVGLLAVLKAGAAYVPLDPAYPADRLAHMLEDSAPAAVLVDAVGAEVLAGTSVPRVHLHDDASLWANVSSVDLDRIEIAVQPHHLAYVIYTSGSTGRPKGVAVEHRNVVNFLDSMGRVPGISRSDVLLAVTTLGFDIAGLELHLPLSVGATIVLAHHEQAADPQALQRVISESRITVMQATPTTWKMLLASGWDGQPGMRILCGGEALTAELSVSLRARVAEVWNMYGPTETTIWSTCWPCNNRNISTVESIGRPIANTQVYVLDEQRRPVPVGVPGELYIGGAGVARGYLHQPELTAQRFLPDPFSALPGARMYKTGDLGRWLPDGTLEYLGRNDFQVKIRGFRIELGEIETQLSRVVEARDVVVLARDDGGDKRLVAYYAGEASPETLREHAQAHLPQYMVPSAYVRVEHWPLTPNGKLDRKALPAPEGDAYVSRGYEAPQGDVEIQLAAIWSELLKVDQVGRHDNFFELGGHSLLAVQLAMRTQASFQVSPPVADLFVSPTLSSYAKTIASLSNGAQSESILVPIRISGTALPLFVVHEGAGSVNYVPALAKWIDSSVPVYGLAAIGDQPGEMPLRTVAEMAKRYIEAIKRVSPHGPYRLCAWSAGGLIAYEIAMQLTALGEVVEFLGMIDTIYGHASRTFQALLQMLKPNYMRAEAERAHLLWWVKTNGLLEDEVTKALEGVSDIDDMLIELAVRGVIAEEEIPSHKQANEKRFALIEALCDYELAIPRLRANASVTIFGASESLAADPFLGWQLCLGETARIVQVNGTHFSIMQEPDIFNLGAELSAALDSSSNVSS